ncbi:MAG: flavodoxin domain-containing protein [Vallitalea sp.]|jgi:menaquinone-dependent protoporphyrinogen IX oxidase|nr:flavodoxin domain-containing protein [Vallitalea sp.]
MKTIVVYRSKSGFVKRYATWIAEELSADLFEYSKVTIEDLMPYDTIIYGGGLYAVGINGVNLIKKNLNKLEDKKIIVFASGATPGRDNEIVEIKNGNFTVEQQKRIEFFYLRGGFDYNKLALIDKILMNLLKLKLKYKSKLTLDEKGMLASYSLPVDFTKKNNIDEIITYVNS